jgi:hypothetical protein
MSKKDKGYIKGELKKTPFLERHRTAFMTVCAVTTAGFIFAPQIRAEIAAYRLLQIQTAESMQLLEAIAMNLGIDEIRDVRT